MLSDWTVHLQTGFSPFAQWVCVTPIFDGQMLMHHFGTVSNAVLMVNMSTTMSTTMLKLDHQWAWAYNLVYKRLFMPGIAVFS